MKKFILEDEANKEFRQRICDLKSFEGSVGFSNDETMMLLGLARSANESRFSNEKLAPAVMNMISDGISLIESTPEEQREEVISRVINVATLTKEVTSIKLDEVSAADLEKKLRDIKIQAECIEGEFKPNGPNRAGQFLSSTLLLLSLLAAAVVIATAVLTAPISLPVMAGAGAAATAINAGLAAGSAVVAANQVAVGAAAATGVAASIAGLALSRDKSPHFKFSAEKVVETLADDVNKHVSPAPGRG